MPLPKVRKILKIIPPLVWVILLAATAYSGYAYFQQRQISQRLTLELTDTRAKLDQVQADLNTLENEDQLKKNRELQKEINDIQKTFSQAVNSYENLLKLKEQTTKTSSLDDLFTKTLTLLAKRSYSDAVDTLNKLNSEISKIQAELAAAAAAAAPAPAANLPVVSTPPESGYRRQAVDTPVGKFTVSIVSADLSSTRVIVDTASDGTCTDNCPVLPLASYAARSGAYAGVNGTYFCPASYPSCAGKTNSFDLLVMNKNKVYFNSDNNVYSNNPAVIFSGSSARFVTAASQWGRDTSVDAVLSNYPLLVLNSNIVYGGDSDPKSGARGGRSFVANQGSKVFIGVVHSATIAESAHVLKAMGMENALNLDNGGSTALWSGGYKVGPGRDLPNVLLFVRK